MEVSGVKVRKPHNYIQKFLAIAEKILEVTKYLLADLMPKKRQNEFMFNFGTQQ